MRPSASSPVNGKPESGPSHGGFGRFAAITEVVLAFGLVHVAWHALKDFTAFGQWDAHKNFIPGLTMVTFTVTVMLLSRRSCAGYGLGTERWSYNLNLGLVCSLSLIAVDAMGLLIIRSQFAARKPLDLHTSGFAGIVTVALLSRIIVLLLVWQKRGVIERIPTLVTVPAIFALLSVLPLVAAHFRRPSMWLPALSLFFASGFGEEIFFRGYIQSRVDQAFGCPFRLLGLEFGAGLLVSSLFFGLVHVLNTVDYFHGRFVFGWLFGVETFFGGLFLGCVRAKTGSVLPGAIVHGMLDAFSRIPSLLP
jgi:membrane protease YdiL (CAAX protease family)